MIHVGRTSQNSDFSGNFLTDVQMRRAVVGGCSRINLPGLPAVCLNISIAMVHFRFGPVAEYLGTVRGETCLVMHLDLLKPLGERRTVGKLQIENCDLTFVLVGEMIEEIDSLLKFLQAIRALADNVGNFFRSLNDQPMLDSRVTNQIGSFRECLSAC